MCGRGGAGAPGTTFRPRRRASSTAAQPPPGNQAARGALRVVTAALQTCGDATVRASRERRRSWVGLAAGHLRSARGPPATTSGCTAAVDLRRRRIRGHRAGRVASGAVHAVLDAGRARGRRQLKLQWTEGVALRAQAFVAPWFGRSWSPRRAAPSLGRAPGPPARRCAPDSRPATQQRSPARIRADQERHGPGAVARQIPDDRASRQAAEVAAGVQHPPAAIVSSSPTYMIAVQ